MLREIAQALSTRRANSQGRQIRPRCCEPIERARRGEKGAPTSKQNTRRNDGYSVTVLRRPLHGPACLQDQTVLEAGRQTVLIKPNEPTLRLVFLAWSNADPRLVMTTCPMLPNLESTSSNSYSRQSGFRSRPVKMALFIL